MFPLHALGSTLVKPRRALAVHAERVPDVRRLRSHQRFQARVQCHVTGHQLLEHHAEPIAPRVDHLFGIVPRGLLEP